MRRSVRFATTASFGALTFALLVTEAAPIDIPTGAISFAGTGSLFSGKTGTSTSKTVNTPKIIFVGTAKRLSAPAGSGRIDVNTPKIEFSGRGTL
jgi:hypothetical protein